MLALLPYRFHFLNICVMNIKMWGKIKKRQLQMKEFLLLGDPSGVTKVLLSSVGAMRRELRQSQAFGGIPRRGQCHSHGLFAWVHHRAN